ncbi:MAG: hypothetical protein B1H06_02060 [Candidatus Cloacimonas sp. 4484_143]|nr:MAG: hypothetical protein B1H06_02060 [Candidatus Cloacimonas sp. 4484_143]RLC52186.1 MAG: hypothetical protein DRI23_03405 [Candidatus Cloacimonadota bacterium]
MADLTGNKSFYNASKDVLLTLSDDNFSAYLTIESPDGIVDENTIKDLLMQAGITNGFEEASRYNRLQNNVKEIGVPFLIARGSNPTSECTVDYMFNRENCFIPDESYDVFEMNKYAKIIKGQPIAKVLVESRNSIGKDLFGNEVTTTDNHHIDPEELFGDNIFFDENTNLLIAQKSGYPYVDFQNKLQIKTDFYINENVSEADFELYGDLVINGDISISKIIIDGNLTVYGNISNCMKPGIFVSGNFAVDDAVNSRLVCDGEFNFHNNLRNCIICASGNIIGDEESILFGGLTQSASSIKLDTIGSQDKHLSEIEIGFAPYLKERIKFLADKLDNIQFIPEGHDTEIDQLKTQIADLEKQYFEIVEQFFEPAVIDYKITITKSVFPETRFRIFDNTHVILDEKSTTTYALVNRNIVINEVDKNT